MDRIVQAVLNAALSKHTMSKVGVAAVERIRTRTRLGKGVTKNSTDPSKLPKLKPQTVEVRKSLKRAGRLTGPNATPGKSALNRTGALLEDLDYVAGYGKLAIGLKSGEQRRIAAELQSSGFVFMNLSKAEIKGLSKIIREEVKKALKGKI